MRISAEPTSALDPETSHLVETSLLELLPRSERNPTGKGSREAGRGGPKAYLLITHSEEQAERLAGKGAKVVDLGGGMDSPAEEDDGEGEGDERRDDGRKKKDGKKDNKRNGGDSRV